MPRLAARLLQGERKKRPSLDLAGAWKRHRILAHMEPPSSCNASRATHTHLCSDQGHCCCDRFAPNAKESVNMLYSNEVGGSSVVGAEILVHMPASAHFWTGAL